MVPQRTNTWTDQEVEAHWDRVSEIYLQENERVKRTHEQRFTESMSHLELRAGMRVLNISSRDAGADDFLKRLQPGCKTVHAEISAGLIRVAEKLRPGILQVKIGSYSKLPFGDSEFDRILSLETLEHVSEPFRFLLELYRVSTPEARLVLSCPPATSEWPYRFYTRFFGGHGEGPHRFLPSKEVRELLRETGWKLISRKGTVLIPVGPSWLQSAGEWIIGRLQGTFVAELGIRQFYICEKGN